MQEFRGRTAVITGAAAGIGRGLAERAGAEGMKVVLADLDAGPLEETAKALREQGVDAIHVVTDVSQPDALRELADRSLEAFGAIHLLCNNAGVFAAGGPVWETPIADFEWQLGVNVMGIVHGLRTFVPILLEQDTEAHIVNTASMAAVTSSPLSAAYYASKHAALSLSETLYHELGLRGSKIGVSVLCPELVDTRIGHSERVRPEIWKRKDEDDDEPRPERELVSQAIREFTSRGAPPSLLADRVFDAVKAERFYVLSPQGNGWRRACESRLEDIRLERNPTFVATTSND